MEDLPPIIALEGVGQSYDGGDNWIIKDCKLSVPDKPAQGEFVVILACRDVANLLFCDTLPASNNPQKELC